MSKEEKDSIENESIKQDCPTCGKPGGYPECPICQKPKGSGVTDPIEKAARDIVENGFLLQLLDNARVAVDDGLRLEYLLSARREISEAIREAVEAENGSIFSQIAPSTCDKWHPIETAPKDGTKILAYPVLDYGELETIGTVWFGEKFVDEVWINAIDCCTEYPTHWMPLPEPPNRGPGS